MTIFYIVVPIVIICLLRVGGARKRARKTPWDRETVDAEKKRKRESHARIATASSGEEFVQAALTEEALNHFKWLTVDMGRTFETAICLTEKAYELPPGKLQAALRDEVLRALKSQTHRTNRVASTRLAAGR